MTLLIGLQIQEYQLYKHLVHIYLEDLQLLFQSEEDGFLQTGSICPDIAAAAVHISGRMAAHIKRSLLGDAGKCMIAAATIDLAF